VAPSFLPRAAFPALSSCPDCATEWAPANPGRLCA